VRPMAEADVTRRGAAEVELVGLGKADEAGRRLTASPACPR
jgi:hypothetical protein